MSDAKCYKCGASGHTAATCTAAVSAPPNTEMTVDEMEGGGKFIELYGDLMGAPESLCHCVSECMAMGAGIAVLFKNTFGRVEELKAQKVKPGGVATLDVTPTDSAAAPRMIYYLVTKPRYFDKPTYASLGASLTAMFTDMAAKGITSIAMPELGCGLDGLQWPKVRQLVKDMIHGTGVTVTVYHFKPAVKLTNRVGKAIVKK